MNSIADDSPSKRNSSKRSSLNSVTLSNGSTSVDHELTQSSHLEEGPVLRPPPPKQEKRESLNRVSKL